MVALQRVAVAGDPRLLGNAAQAVRVANDRGVVVMGKRAKFEAGEVNGVVDTAQKLASGLHEFNYAMEGMRADLPADLGQIRRLAQDMVILAEAACTSAKLLNIAATMAEQNAELERLRKAKAT